MNWKALLLSFIISSTMMPAVAQTKEESKLASAVESLRRAMLDPTPEKLKSMTSAKLSYGHSSGAIDNQDIFLDRLLSGRSDFTELKFEKQSISISNQVGIVRHELHAKTNDSGNPGEVHLHVLLVWKKEKSKWVLLARQAVRMP